MQFIISQEWTSKKTGKSGKSYYMGVINIPMFGDQLQTSSFIKDAKKFDSEAEAKKILPYMVKNAVIECYPVS